jgi:hypothetical protein
MRKVKFNCKRVHAPAYGCSLPGNNSGAYYLATDVDDRLAELEAEIERLRKDRDRLEWLVKNEMFVARVGNEYEIGEWINDYDTPYGERKHANWREAIDAAMEGE